MNKEEYEIFVRGHIYAWGEVVAYLESHPGVTSGETLEFLNERIAQVKKNLKEAGWKVPSYREEQN